MVSLSLYPRDCEKLEIFYHQESFLHPHPLTTPLMVFLRWKRSVRVLR
jgi:hypothetical protein